MNETIAKLAKEKFVEKLVKSYYINSPYRDDLCQDLYIELLKKDQTLVQQLYDNNQLQYYIRKMITNNIKSKTSPYYKNYEKYRQLADNIDDKKNKI